ncbi:Uncharacterized conserved protein YdeI, YjbR/CyaY-like superfamily, DUF1801 family [Flavobacterium fryxellicola]|uniref:Bacteriocin-protection protein n=1 Tax=Flavobacterium fryxellicola TaxID=249352 RepID=A0A167V9Z3_9FLAO|nr:YdeI/OmpD-associated family protein [Flavobacterium fryxellicola]OAB26207.1 hypothetical protein FBFR_13290 [Flavobacterium fryxellicola]SHN79550.1 Uncharacterized conserved protein YdeI, YjbR/CyaY-like superfamily, DUF1801 family [Flavobacterium fryxellicola]
MTKTENFDQIEVTSSAELREWLLKNHAQKESIWLVTYKKETIEKYVSIQEVLDQLLCFGWIDGIRRKLDDKKTMQLISPRKVEHWAQTYKVRFAKLQQEGLLHQSGINSVIASKESGLWNFMDDVDNLVIPEDLHHALKEHKLASHYFEAFSSSNKRFILRYIKLAKTEQTRQKRILQVATLAAENKKIPGV